MISITFCKNFLCHHTFPQGPLLRTSKCIEGGVVGREVGGRSIVSFNGKSVIFSFIQKYCSSLTAYEILKPRTQLLVISINLIYLKLSYLPMAPQPPLGHLGGCIGCQSPEPVVESTAQVMSMSHSSQQQLTTPPFLPW